MKPKKKTLTKLQKKAKELNKPLHLRPKVFEQYQQNAMLRAQHLAEMDMRHKKHEADKLTHAISTVHPSLQRELIQQRSKLLK